MFFRLIDIKKVYKNNKENIVALNGVTLDINEGDYISFVGPSGAGKSTLLLILAGLIRPTAGDIYFKSKKLTRLPEKEWTLLRKRYIGFIFQKKIIISHLTVKENILAPLVFIEEKEKKEEFIHYAEKLIEEYDLKKYINFYPDNLSGGELQKLLIVRALVTKPKILLADEPTGDLDNQSSKDIIKKLSSLNKKGLTIVMVTHNQILAESSKSIYRINKGEIEKILK